MLGVQTQKVPPDCLMLRTSINGQPKVLQDFEDGRETTLADYGLVPREGPYTVFVLITAPQPKARLEQAAVAAVETSVGKIIIRMGFNIIWQVIEITVSLQSASVQGFFKLPTVALAGYRDCLKRSRSK
jgi:hypothetical protein